MPGSTAAATLTSPAPAVSGEASRVPASSTKAGLAVAISAPLTSAGVQSGCACSEQGGGARDDRARHRGAVVDRPVARHVLPRVGHRREDGDAGRRDVRASAGGRTASARPTRTSPRRRARRAPAASPRAPSGARSSRPRGRRRPRRRRARARPARARRSSRTRPRAGRRPAARRGSRSRRRRARSAPCG